MLRSYPPVLCLVLTCLGFPAAADQSSMRTKHALQAESTRAAVMQMGEPQQYSEALHQQRMQEMRDWNRLREMARQDQEYYDGAPLAQTVFRDTPHR